MGADSKIEWTHHTFNPWIGCTKVSAACDHCYAESWAKRTGKPELWFGDRRRTSSSNWQQPIKWNRAAAAAGERARVFCASLADVFDNQVPREWRWDLWKLIAGTRSLDWMLLTKRPQNIGKMLPVMDSSQPGYLPWNERWPWRNVWLGTTVGVRADLRNIDHLRAVPAAVRFLSIEPLLEDLGTLDLTGIHLVIVGGESGPNARPMHPDWARRIRDQCKAAGVAYFHKQNGEWAPGEAVAGPPKRTEIGAWWFADRWTFQPVTLRESEEMHVDDEPAVWRVGKTRAGRLLDGVEHNAMPASSA